MFMASHVDLDDELVAGAEAHQVAPDHVFHEFDVLGVGLQGEQQRAVGCGEGQVGVGERDRAVAGLVVPGALGLA